GHELDARTPYVVEWASGGARRTSLPARGKRRRESPFLKTGQRYCQSVQVVSVSLSPRTRSVEPFTPNELRWAGGIIIDRNPDHYRFPGGDEAS
ncbi:MAG: hypothetical protein KJ749_05590, partial [Planctomycetes bacterium]|nr:hypothetical protein [Planctomycetota bacterium]